MKNLLQLLLVLGLFCFQNLKSQEAELDSLLDAILFEDEDLFSFMTGKTHYHFLYLRGHAENRSFFSGRDIGIEQQNYSAQASWFHSSGLNAGLGTIWYSQFSPKLYATSLSLGYSGKYGKSNDYRYRASYSRYIYSRVDSIESHAFNNAFSLGTTLDKGIIGARLDLTLLSGEEVAGQLSLDLYADIALVKLGAFDRIKFEPEVSLFFGQEIVAFYELGGLVQNQEYVWVEDSGFGLLNTSIHLPLTMDYKNLDLEIGYNINFPISMLTGEKLPMTTYFNISLGYIIGFN